MLDLVSLANERKWKVYVLGSTKKVNSNALKKFKKEYPNAEFQGNSGPLFDNKVQFVTDKDIKLHIEIVKHINDYKPQLLLVALGAPKQELWIKKNLTAMRVNCAITIGGSLDYYINSVPLPPEWMARGGLEWIWRLVKNPSRIIRIFNAIIVFPILALQEKLTMSSPT